MWRSAGPAPTWWWATAAEPRLGTLAPEGETTVEGPWVGRTIGLELVDEVVRHEDAYRLRHIRGPGGILIGLAEAITPG